MATLNAQLAEIQITPGVQPNTDKTPLSTVHYTMSDKIRSRNGIVQKIGGWVGFTFQYGATIQGIARTLYSAVIANIATSVIGTNSYLYSLFGQSLTNITPLLTATNAIPNSLSTDYGTLANNPITTQTGTGNLIIADTHASKYQVNDPYTLSGAATTNGILNTDINAEHVIRAIGTNTVTLLVAGSASSSGTGGGASVVRSTGLITVAAIAHEMSNGWRTKITDATDAGGVLAADINAEFIIRNVLADNFDVMTAGTATSSVTADGGASTKFQKQLTAGNVNQSLGLGYGMGLYGAGLYGTAKMSQSGITYPRIWFADRFGDRIISTPGNQSGVYVWDGSTAEAPALLANAPTDVNYAFVSDNILVTFGHGSINNQIFSSDQNDATIWAASSTNQVYQDVIEGAGRLLSSVPVLGINLLFTPSQTYTFEYIGLPNIWKIKLLDNSVGIIAPMARCSVNGVAYWMAQNNFYRWSGGNVEQIPANTQDQCTFLQYVYGNINQAQVSKSFAWYNDMFNEIWFHYPSNDSNEPNRIARVSIDDNVWWPDTMDRTCAEYPDNSFVQPRLISSEGEFFIHETGSNDNLAPLPFFLESNLMPTGKNTGLITGFVPDNLTQGDTEVRITGQLWPQSSDLAYDKTFVVTDSGIGDEPRENIQIAGRFLKYFWTGSALNQPWIMGMWNQLVQKGPNN